MASDYGFLSKTQREYLMGDYEPPSAGAERKMRSDIRERTQAALEDFDILGYGVEERDAKQIMYDSKPEFEVERWEEVLGVASDGKSHALNLTGLMAFIYIATRGDPGSPEMFMQQGLKRVYRRRNRVLEDFEVAFAAIPGKSVEEMDTENPGELSDKELREALRVGEIDPDDLREVRDEVAEKPGFNHEIVDGHIEGLEKADEVVDLYPDL